MNFYRMFQPILIGRLLLYFNTEGQKTTDLEHAYIYATCITISTLVSMILFHMPQVDMIHYGMKMRIACCSIIFRKVCLIINENRLFLYAVFCTIQYQLFAYLSKLTIISDWKSCYYISDS